MKMLFKQCGHHRNMRGNNALYTVINRKNIALLRILISHNIDVDFHKPNECTPIEYACIYGNARVVKELVDAGCSLNYDKNEICQILAARNRVHTLRFLIDRGMKPDQQGWDGRTGLHWAAQEGQYAEIVSLLLESGAEVDWRDKDGRTALFYAKANEQKKVAKILENYGADTGIVDKYGISIKDLKRKEI